MARRARAKDRQKAPSVGLISSFSFPFLAAAWAREPIRRIKGFHGSSLPIWLRSAISANFIARLIKGCRVDARAGCSISGIAKHFQRSNEHFSRESAPWARFSAATGEPNAQAEDQVRRQKALQGDCHRQSNGRPARQAPRHDQADEKADSSAPRHPRAVQDRRRQYQEIFLAQRLIARAIPLAEPRPRGDPSPIFQMKETRHV